MRTETAQWWMPQKRLCKGLSTYHKGKHPACCPKEKSALHVSTNSGYSKTFSLKPKIILIWQDNFISMLAKKGGGVCRKIISFSVPIMFWSVRLQRFGARIFPLVWHWWLFGVLGPQMFGPDVDVQYVQLLRQMVSSKIFPNFWKYTTLEPNKGDSWNWKIM